MQSRQLLAVATAILHPSLLSYAFCLRPGRQQLLNESLGFLLLVAAAAGDPLGKGVERLLICHG